MVATSLYLNSVAPVTALALTHTTVKVTWYSANPSTYTALRLVRNQYAFSETQEDGNILYEFNNEGGGGASPVHQFIDGTDSSLSTVNLVSGQYAYYTVWLLISDAWVNAGSAFVLVPKQHSVLANGVELKNTHMKVMELLPRVMTSTSNSPFDAVDKTSDLYKFIKGIALTYDEVLTYADLTVRSLPAKFIANNQVIPMMNDLGLRVTSTTPTVYKKNLISKAPYLFSIKGTAAALTNFVETFTGFNTTVSFSNNPNSKLGLVNLLLNPQDSNFYNGGLGFWNPVSGVTLSTESSADLPAAEQYSFRSGYRLKAITTSGIQANFRLGLPPSDAPATIRRNEALGYGIPVTAGTGYDFKYYCKVGSGTVSLTPFVSWFDQYGVSITTDNPSTSSPTTSWAKYSSSFTAPGKAITATAYTVGTSSTNTVITLPTGHGFDTSTNNKVWFEDEFLPFTGGFTISAYTSTSITIPYSAPSSTLVLVFSSGTTFTVGSGSLKYVVPGQTVTVTSGTGTLAGTTKVTAITGSNTFTVDTVPSVALSGAQISVDTYTVTKEFTVYKGTGSPIIKQPLAKYAVIGFKNNNVATTFYLSSIQFASSANSSSASFIEPRSIDVFLDPSKINYLIDPSFLGSGWSSSGTFSKTEDTTLTGVPYTSVNGTKGKMGKVVTSSSNTTPSTPDLKTAAATPITDNNTYYTFSIYIKGDAAYSLTLGLTDGVNSSEKVINVTTSWQRVYVNLYVTSISTGLTPYIYSNSASLATGGNGTRSAAQTFRVDNAQLEECASPSDYFDGNFINQGAFWSGASNASKSYLYVNKDQKLSELALHMTDWVPLNTTWMVRSQLGIEAIGAPITGTIDSGIGIPRSGGRGNLLLL
jgi:hypothetical protein